MVESGHYSQLPLCRLYSQSQDGRCGEDRRRVYEWTVTPECSENGTALPSVVKTESELCVYTRVSTLQNENFKLVDPYRVLFSSIHARDRQAAAFCGCYPSRPIVVLQLQHSKKTWWCQVLWDQLTGKNRFLDGNQKCSVYYIISYPPTCTILSMLKHSLPQMKWRSIQISVSS